MSPLSEAFVKLALRRIEIKRALVGDDRPAPNGEEFERYMLRLLARQERRERRCDHA